MKEKQVEANYKQQGGVVDNKASQKSIELLEPTVDGLGQSTTDNLKLLEMMGDTNFTMSNFHQAKRSSIINQADVYSQRQVMREALKLTVADDKQGGINDQVWYDSLRETDDGRFSQTQIFAH